MLLIGEGLALSEQLVTEKIGVFGISGSGKTNTAGVLVEEMFGAGQHVVVCDPLGVCWGLLSSADGRAPGLSLVVFGGTHAHVPLCHDQGQEIANVILGERLSCILDLSEFDRAQMTLFMSDFIRRLLRTNAEPLHLVFDEAQLFAPQSPDKQQQPLISAMERLTLTGRVRGLGMTFVSQRPTLVSKNVVSQMGLLIAHKISHVADQKTLLDWARPKFSDPADLQLMGSTLALQRKGFAWIVGDVDDMVVSGQSHIRLRNTFDSSATPRVGEQVRTAQTLATVDLSSLQARLARDAETAEHEDPERLRRQIARLQDELRAQRPPERVEVPVLRPEDVSRLEEVCAAVIAIGKDQVAQGQELLALGNGITAVLKDFRHPAPPTAPEYREAAETAVLSEHPVDRSEIVPAKSRAGATLDHPAPPADRPHLDLPTGARHLVNTLARAYPRKLTRSQWGSLAKRAPSGGAFAESYRCLMQSGLIAEQGGFIVLTAQGCAAFGLEPNPKAQTLQETLDLWRGALKQREMEILQLVAGMAPGFLTKEEIASRVCMEASGGAFLAYLQVLRQNDLINVRGKEVRLNPALSDEAVGSAGKKA
jgi:hypothetical protein